MYACYSIVWTKLIQSCLITQVSQLKLGKVYCRGGCGLCAIHCDELVSRLAGRYNCWLRVQQIQFCLRINTECSAKGKVCLVYIYRLQCISSQCCIGYSATFHTSAFWLLGCSNLDVLLEELLIDGAEICWSDAENIVGYLKRRWFHLTQYSAKSGKANWTHV